MTEIGKFLIGLGIVIAIIGIALLAAGKVGFKGLPGDIRYESPHMQVYFPIVSCIVLSILLTLGMWIWRWLSGR
ncbi:MAG TPA: DUF2905 domain-containing protein [Tepidisphaeraceae bacterium]